MSDITKKLEVLIAESKSDKSKVAQVFELVATMVQLGHHEGEETVYTVMKAGVDAPDGLLDRTLEGFMQTWRDWDHGSWVHSVSHFTGDLWKIRPAMDKWIKEINRVAFKGADELGDSNCCDRLVNDFARFARWDEDPADFGLTLDNLKWMNWKYCAYSKARIEHGKFTSEAEYVYWQIQQAVSTKSFDFDAQMDLVPVSGIQSLMEKLVELGGNAGDFAGVLKSLLVTQLAELEAQLSTETTDFKIKRLQKGLEKTKSALASLA